MGKSSLINMLLQRKKLARTSKRPGKTQEINFYVVNGDLAVVDLPGYGFAKAPEEVRQKWGPLIESYLATADELLGAVHLIDSRHGPTGDDRQLFDYLARLEIPTLFVLTKVDKLKGSDRPEAVEKVTETLQVPEDQVLLTSALTGEGRRDLLDSVEALIEAGADRAPEDAGKDGRGAIRPGG